MMTDDRAAIRRAVERLSARRFARDLALAGEFEPDAIVAGSEAHELHFGAAEIRDHFAANMGKPHTVRWEWERLEIDTAGDTGWFFAHGAVLVGRDGAETRLPFRMSGVLVRRDGEWRWKLLHASEPAP